MNLIAPISASAQADRSSGLQPIARAHLTLVTPTGYKHEVVDVAAGARSGGHASFDDAVRAVEQLSRPRGENLLVGVVERSDAGRATFDIVELLRLDDRGRSLGWLPGGGAEWGLPDPGFTNWIARVPDTPLRAVHILMADRVARIDLLDDAPAPGNA